MAAMSWVENLAPLRRINAKIEPEWVEPLAGRLIKAAA